MSYLQTAASLAQVHLNAQQLQQLNLLNSQLSAQQQAAAMQANLGQALFETERMAGRVAATMRPDLFAAAVLSFTWLESVGGIGPAQFVNVEHKRAWSSAHGVLTSAVSLAKADPAIDVMVRDYLRGTRDMQGLLRPLGGNPERFLAGARQRIDLAVSQKTKAAAVVKVSAIALGASFVLGVVGAAAKTRGLVTLATLAMFGAIGALVAKLIEASTATSQLRRAEQQLAADQQLVDAYTSFMQNPSTGGFVTRLWKEHPLLFKEPTPTPDSLSGGSAQAAVQTFVERSVVERQIVVVRCRYCNQLSPVDGPTCRHCGAAGFAA